MVAEYPRKFYSPAYIRWNYLTESAMEKVKALSAWKNNIRNAWGDLAIENVDVKIDDGTKVYKLNVKQPQLEVGSQVRVDATIRLGRLSPEDIAVEIYYGTVDSAGNIESGQVVRMEYKQNGHTEGTGLFAGAIPCKMSGRHGFALRILPKHTDLVEPYEPGMILWETPTKT